MQSPQFPAGCFADHVGFSWMIKDVGGVRTVAHGGNISNLQLSTFLMVPSRGFAITVLTNSGSGAGLGAEIEKWVLEKYLRLKAPDPVLVPLPEADLRQYAGRYESKLLAADVTLKGRGLEMQAGFNVKLEDYPEDQHELLKQILSARPRPVRLSTLGPDRVVSAGKGGGSRGEFLRPTPTADVKWLRWGGRLMVKAG